MDLTKVNESVADYFIFCEASNVIQLKTIADFIEEEVRIHLQDKPYRVDGSKGQQWIIIDYVDIVVHCMMPQIRTFYNIEELWHDANKLEF